MEIISKKSLIIKLHKQAHFPENEFRYIDTIKRFAQLLHFENCTPIGDQSDRSKPLRIEFRNGFISNLKIDVLTIEGRKIFYVVNEATEIAEKEISPKITAFVKSLLQNIELQSVITTYQSSITSKLNISLKNIYTKEFLMFTESLKDKDSNIHSIVFNLLNFKLTYNTPPELSHENIYLSKKDLRFGKNDTQDDNDNIFETEMPFQTEQHIKLLEAFEASF